MPARVVQRYEHIPRDEWCAFCIECGWVGTPGIDQAACAQGAYTHNLVRHDGAGVDPQLEDFLPPGVDDELKRYRRLFRLAAAAAVFGLVVAVFICAFNDDDLLRPVLVGVNVLCACLNAFMAGRWALKLEQVAFLGPVPEDH